MLQASEHQGRHSYGKDQIKLLYPALVAPIMPRCSGSLIPPFHIQKLPSKENRGAAREDLPRLSAVIVTSSFAFGREARLVRYPHYHDGRSFFSYLGDSWTANEKANASACCSIALAMLWTLLADGK